MQPPKVSAPETEQTSAPKPPAVVVPLRVNRRSGRQAELEFLPAALEIVETPASPVGRAIAGVIILFAVIAAIWASLGHVDIITTAQGKIVPTGRTKIIQPLEAGMVTAIHVKDGDRVTKDQVLVEMDHVASTAERNRVGFELMNSQMDVARLKALADGLDAGIVAEFKPPPDAPVYQIARTRAALRAQAAQQAAKLSALDQQILQKSAEMEETATIIAKLTASLPLVEETAGIREKAMRMEYGNRIAHLEAQLKLLETRHELTAQDHKSAEVEAAKQSLEFQREQAKAEYAQGVAADLAEAEQKVAQLSEDIVKAEKKMQDQILRAPIEGTVQQLAIHTVGGVVTPAQTLMAIVPADSHLEIEAMVLNRDIGFVEPGQSAEIKIDTFNFTRYGLLYGKVLDLSHDAIVREKPATKPGAAPASAAADSSEPQGQELLYFARVALDQNWMQIADKRVNLEAGMAVTVEIKTGTRRIIEYVLSPLLRYRQESLRER
jgi:membrane fusion protein, hemolysin D